LVVAAEAVVAGSVAVVVVVAAAVVDWAADLVGTLSSGDLDHR